MVLISSVSTVEKSVSRSVHDVLVILFSVGVVVSLVRMSIVIVLVSVVVSVVNFLC